MSYWREREEEHIKKSIKDDKILAERLAANQRRAMKEIQQQIDAFYGKYATTEGITMTEARKRVSKLDIDAYAEKAKRYVKYAHSDNDDIKAQAFTDRANEEMRIYNLTMKVSRLELLKLNINLELAKMGSAEEHFLTDKFTEAARAEYKRQAGILGETVAYNAVALKNVVNASFLNAKWSDRLWTNQAALRDELNTLLNRGIIQGKNPKVLARELKKKFDVSTGDAERLMITELGRIQTEVQKDAFNQLEVEEYEYIAEPDACPRCSPLNGQIFKVSEMDPGINAPVRHPRCRCSTAAVSGRDAWERSLTVRGLGKRGGK